MEVYEPTHEEDIRTQRNGMSGAMIDKYTVVPQFKGTYPIRPISFSYFNPKTEEYTSLSSEEIIIDVENGPINEENTKNTIKKDGKQEVLAENEQFKYIKLKANLEPIVRERFFKSDLFWILLAAPFFIIPLFILIGRKRRQRLADVDGNRLRRANRLAKKYLGAAKKRMGNKITFYEALERALHNYLKAKLNIETSEMDQTHIAKLLAERSVDPTVVSDFTALLQRCDFARYTPASNVTIKLDYETAVKTISNIDKQFTVG